MDFEALLKELAEMKAALIQLSEMSLFNLPMDRKTAAKYLRIHPDTLYQWAVEDGKIAYSRLGDGKRAALRFLRKDLDDFLAQDRVPTVKERSGHWSGSVK